MFDANFKIPWLHCSSDYLQTSYVTIVDYRVFLILSTNIKTKAIAINIVNEVIHDGAIPDAYCSSNIVNRYKGMEKAVDRNNYKYM